ncbi:class I SAM-dependent methyltransferase [Kribbella deserti]|uniref:Class I SAM-dependent methyltransferase n=1 Tax=Kribbella deserti TaxID=1926257 RepID=A0ABV6QGP1_9ACTN
MGREELRLTFGEDPELYDRMRPGYPPGLFDTLAEVLAGPGSAAGGVPAEGAGALAAGALGEPRVLEIGCGTGQATRSMIERGWSVTAVELSPALSAVARRNLPEAEVVTASFEDWPLPAEPFELVIAATSWHWIDPEVRMVKAAQALRPGGSLAIVSTYHVAGGTQQFFDDVQACYERFDPETKPGLRLPPEDATADDPGEYDRTGLFGPVRFNRWGWDLTYTTSEYLDLLSTYSGHRAMPPEARDSLYACIATLINTNHHGQVTKRYLTGLTTAPKR